MLKEGNFRICSQVAAGSLNMREKLSEAETEQAWSAKYLGDGGEGS